MPQVQPDCGASCGGFPVEGAAVRLLQGIEPEHRLVQRPEASVHDPPLSERHHRLDQVGRLDGVCRGEERSVQVLAQASFLLCAGAFLGVAILRLRGVSLIGSTTIL
jgi:hypothetical protein